MTSVTRKLMAIASIGAVSLTMAACGSGDDQDADAPSKETQATPVDVDTFTLDQIDEKLDGTTIAEQVVNKRDVTADDLSADIDSFQKTKDEFTSDPEECIRIMPDPVYRMDPTSDPKNISLFVTDDDDATLTGVMYNISPSDTVTKEMDANLDIAPTCEKFTAELYGEKGEVITKASEITGYDTIADKTVKTMVGTKAGDEDDFDKIVIYQLLLNNGQYLYVSADTDDVAKQALDDTLDALGITVK